MLYLWTFSYPPGPLTLVEEKGALTHILFPGQSLPPLFQREKTPLLAEANRQISQYLQGERRCFSLPLSFHGTPFQELVWRGLMDIPYGCTVSYSELARRIGRPGASRAVGAANHVNPLPLILPCHRVIGKNGSLTGYAGGLHWKRFLLDLEKGIL